MGARLQVVAGALLLFGCASVESGASSGGRFSRGELIDVFVRWREAERRRDPELAEEVLHFRGRRDREALRRELEALRTLPSGTVRAHSEIHLAGHPPDWGEGEYLFLEPAGSTFAPRHARIARRADGSPAIAYQPPVVGVAERRSLRPEEIQSRLLDDRLAFWRGLQGRALAEEVQRTRVLLERELAAVEYAARAGLPMAPLEPDPSELLAELAPLDPEQARQLIVPRLEGSR